MHELGGSNVNSYFSDWCLVGLVPGVYTGFDGFIGLAGKFCVKFQFVSLLCTINF